MGKHKQDAIVESVRAILDEAQKSIATHKKGIVLLRKLQKEDVVVFRRAMLAAIHKMLLIFKREPAIDRLVALLKSFSNACAKDLNEDTPCFAIHVMEEILPFSNAKEKAVRFRVCQIVAALLADLQEDISDETWDDLSERLLFRLVDKIPVVRIAAVQGLRRLQISNDPDDEVTQQLIQTMECDSNRDARKAALEALMVTRVTLDPILGRLRDIKDEVRCAALKKLSNMHPKPLRRGPRIEVVLAVLSARSPSVQEAGRRLLQQWLVHLKGDVIELLHMLRSVQHESLGVRVIRMLVQMIDSQPADLAEEVYAVLETKIDTACLTPESALLWRVRCEIAAKRDDVCQDALPDVAPFVGLLTEWIRKTKQRKGKRVTTTAFVTRQLLGIARSLDFSDEMGRSLLIAALRNAVPSAAIPVVLLPTVVAALYSAHPTVADAISDTAELVSEICDPIQEQTLLSEASTLVEDVDVSVEESGPKSEAELQKYKADRERNALVVTISLLGGLSPKEGGHASLETLLSSVILPAIASVSPSQRALAMRALGLFCLLNVAEARKHLTLFCEALKVDSGVVGLVALQCLVDLLRVHDLSVLFDDEESKEPVEKAAESMEGLAIDAFASGKSAKKEEVMNTIQTRLMALIESDDVAFRGVAVLCMSQLLLVNVLPSPMNVIEAMLLISFHKPTEKEALALEEEEAHLQEGILIGARFGLHWELRDVAMSIALDMDDALWPSTIRLTQLLHVFFSTFAKTGGCALKMLTGCFCNVIRLVLGTHATQLAPAKRSRSKSRPTRKKGVELLDGVSITTVISALLTWISEAEAAVRARTKEPLPGTQGPILVECLEEVLAIGSRVDTKEILKALELVDWEQCSAAELLLVQHLVVEAAASFTDRVSAARLRKLRERTAAALEGKDPEAADVGERASRKRVDARYFAIYGKKRDRQLSDESSSEDGEEEGPVEGAERDKGRRKLGGSAVALVDESSSSGTDSDFESS